LKNWIAAALVLMAAALILIATTTCGVRAEDYPARPVTIIVPFAAGGPADITARIVADIFSRHLGQRFIVENVGGAGGTIGTLRAARAAPDGYTVLSGHIGTNALAAAFYPDLGYDPRKDFEPIGLTAEYPELLVVRKEFPARDLHEFVAYAKANAAKLNVGHAGVGSVSYIGCLLLDAAIGIRPTMVPFTGTAPVLNAMLAGEIDYECDPVLGTMAQVRAGAVRALAIAAKKRSPMLPDVPTSYEQGFPEFDIAPFYAAFVPKGTPRPIVDKLAAALNEGLNEEAVQKRLAELGSNIIEPERRGPKPLAELVRSEAARLMPIIKTAADK
jgi:tripartite-type tricarboxylate transporter receptor subunit TctC